MTESYIVAATTSSFGAGNEDIWVLKLDKDVGCGVAKDLWISGK